MMEVVSNNGCAEIIARAESFEKSEEYSLAAKEYELALKSVPTNEKVLRRLMIIYRKLKKYKKEISIIDKAIKIHSRHYQSSKSTGSVITTLSRKLNILLGNIDKKGKQLINPEIVNNLIKRKEAILKKITS